ncbi:MAG: microcompartment protein EutL [Bacteroidetes bacterium 4572_77]|nr:MAG: microcompartment protein EutL [Bacteroidetes bacterium 4572_77]
MKGDLVRAKVLSVKIIPNVNKDLAKAMKLKKNRVSVGIITTDIDDVSYTALDEATKKADVEVVYAKSLYAGSNNASTKLSGEFIGIIAGSNPSEVRFGLYAAIEFIENSAYFYSANDDDSIVYYSHCISRTGSYLSKIAQIKEGDSLSYLIAPPIESMYALDVALKSADVKLVKFYGPPTETNFGGGLLTGDQSACKAACDAFEEAVKFVAENPVKY